MPIVFADAHSRLLLHPPPPRQLVELKNSETYNGHLVDCDNFMNITLRDVYLTSPDGEKFWNLKEVYVRGNMVRRRLFRHDLREKGPCSQIIREIDVLTLT